MCRDGNVHDWVRQLERVSLYVSLGGEDLRPSGPSSGSTGSVRIYARTYEQYIPNIYGWGVEDVDRSTVGGVGRGRRATVSDSDCHERISVLCDDGTGSRTTLDLTHVRNSLGHMV
jgi:hypothetical protein